MKQSDKDKPNPWKTRRATNFYPLYGEGRDIVTPVSGIAPTLFQEIIPRYRLSSSDTRDLGVGPTFLEYDCQPAIVVHRREPEEHQTSSQNPTGSNKRKKIRIDFNW